MNELTILLIILGLAFSFLIGFISGWFLYFYRITEDEKKSIDNDKFIEN